MDTHQSGQLTPVTAKKIARDWIDSQYDRPPRWSQLRGLMDDLAERCIAETIRRGEGESELETRLSHAVSVIPTALRDDAITDEIRSLRHQDPSSLSADERKRLDQAIGVVWHRHDPQVSFVEGWQSKYCFKCETDVLYSELAGYLEKQWLRHPTIDWIFLDMMITREICAVGEDIKMNAMPRPLFSVHRSYLETKGKLKEMKSVDWPTTGLVLLINTLFIGVPLGASYGVLQFGNETVGWFLLFAYLLIIAIVLVAKIAQWFPRGFRKLGSDDRLNPLLLWEKMYAVWRSLDGPVVNPSVVREEMMKSRDEGAVWPVPAWALIDRIIEIDPAVWVTHPSR